MTKRVLAIAFTLVALAAFTLSGPAAASQRYYWTGTTEQQIDLLEHCNGAETYPADTPFWVAHGFLFEGWSAFTPQEKEARMLPTTHFELQIDGTVQPSAMLALYIPQLDLKAKIFPSGYDNGFPAGEHDFLGTWYVDGSIVGGTLRTSVVDMTCSVVVTFV